MAESIIGGAYLSADKNTWHDADGKVIAAPALGSVPAAPQPAPVPQPAPEPEPTPEPMLDAKQTARVNKNKTDK